MKKPNYIMIHHTAVSHQSNPDQFNANNAYHKSLWNFKSSIGYYLGYNYEINFKGSQRQARENGERTAACYQADMNDGRCIHIALDGHFDNEKPNAPQIFVLRDLLRKLVKEYDIKKENIVPHSDYANKTCPGKNIDINFIRGLVIWEKEPIKAEPKEKILTKDEKKAQIIKLIQEL